MAGYGISYGAEYVCVGGRPSSRAAAATNGLNVEPVGKPKLEPPQAESTEKLISVSFLP